MRLPYDYWTVRYVPDAVRGEFVNIGVIAGRGDDWALRRASSLRRAAQLGGEPTITRQFLSRIESTITTALDAVEHTLFSTAAERMSAGVLEDLRTRLHNTVQLGERRPVMAASADEAAELAFGLMVVDGPHAVRQTSRQRMLRTLTASFKAEASLADHVATEARAAMGVQRETFNFAVSDGDVVQLTQAWAFDVKDQNEVANRIGAFNYRVGLIRQEGARLAPSSTGRIRTSGVVPSHVPIAAVYAPPAEQRGYENLEVALDGWKRLGVTPVPEEKASEIVDQAKSLVAV